MTLMDSLCAHKDPVVAYRARRLLAGESEHSPAMRGLRRSIGATKLAQRLLMGLRMERFNPYRKWQGPHWTLYSLAEIGYPTGDTALLPLRERVLDWMLAPAFLKPPSTVIYHDQLERGTYADWGPLNKRKANPLVTVDALYVLHEAGRG